MVDERNKKKIITISLSSGEQGGTINSKIVMFSNYQHCVVDSIIKESLFRFYNKYMLFANNGCFLFRKDDRSK